MHVIVCFKPCVAFFFFLAFSLCTSPHTCWRWMLLFIAPLWSLLEHDGTFFDSFSPGRQFVWMKDSQLPQHFQKFLLVPFLLLHFLNTLASAFSCIFCCTELSLFSAPTYWLTVMTSAALDSFGRSSQHDVKTVLSPCVVGRVCFIALFSPMQICIHAKLRKC